MTVKLNPHFSFKDNARDAMTFYQSVLGGKLNVQTFKELNAAEAPAEEGLVVHAHLETDSGLTIMAADTPDRSEFNPGTNVNMFLSGAAADDGALRRCFDRLSEGGRVTIPLERAVWGDTFGTCVDRFGINWMVDIGGAG